MDGFDISQRAHPLATPGGKLQGSARISPPRVRVPYIGGEELDETPRGIGARRK